MEAVLSVFNAVFEWKWLLVIWPLLTLLYAYEFGPARKQHIDQSYIKRFENRRGGVYVEGCNSGYSGRVVCVKKAAR